MPVLYFFGLMSLWILQFLLFRTRQKSTPVKSAPISRWGMLFQFLGYWAVFFPARTAWTDPIPAWRLVVAIAFGVLGIWLASTGVRHLGKQWRMKAALNADHELVTSGPYRIIRHPIYASMFAMMIMSVLLLGKLPWWPIAIALFLTGIEIRIHAEDRLLRERFGSRFEGWKSKVPAYVPLLR